MSCLILINDEVKSYDERLQFRGPQPVSQEIVLLLIKSSDFELTKHESEYTESSYWDEELWTKTLGKILSFQPKSIGITAFFPDTLPHTAGDPILSHEKIFWATLGNLRPLGANITSSNVGSAEFVRDNDGIIRRFFSNRSDLPHLAEKIAMKSKAHGWIPDYINFRGDNKVFQQISLNDLSNNKVPQKMIKNKIVIIGIDGFFHQTPMGNFTRAHLVAHITDNILQNRWIYRAPYWAYAILLFCITILSVIIITQYPQKIAIAFLAWLGLLSSALSIWVFDSFYVWLPVLSPLTGIVFCWIIFVSYQANRMEQKTWELKQEKLYLSSLEQLKNNFVSLISHDLKTPIAKIQSTVDRLLLDNAYEAIAKDLKSLRSSSEELHKYIQSILQLLRVESKDFRLHIEACDLNEVIEQALTQLKPLAAEKNILIESQLEPLFSIEADVTLIREVVINLLDNAIKYTQSGGKIQIFSTENENSALVTIKDNGQGIATEDLKLIWNKFTRGKDQDMKSKGTGLGLYLVKYFIELHGGTVNLESTLHQGTTIQFSLPLESEL